MVSASSRLGQNVDQVHGLVFAVVLFLTNIRLGPLGDT